MRIPGLKAARRVGHWLHSRIEPRALILGYHRVAAADPDLLGMCTPPDSFARQLEIVRTEANPISVDELVDGLARGSLPPRALCVTLDDGYFDALENAAPALVAAGVPATVFVVSGLVDVVPWWERLAAIVATAERIPRHIELPSEGKPIAWQSASDSPSRAEVVLGLQRELIDLDTPVRDCVLDELSGAIAPGATPPSGPRLLSRDELGRLAAQPGIAIGSHSATHPRLASLSESAQKAEIESSRHELEGALGRPPRAFSYPNGSCTSATHRLVEGAGFECAFTSATGVATPRGDRLALPRFWVGDLDDETLIRLLRHWR